jgi:hypothetical protein
VGSVVRVNCRLAIAPMMIEAFFEEYSNLEIIAAHGDGTVRSANAARIFDL